MELVSDIEAFTLTAGAFIEYYNASLLKRNGIEDTPEVREAILNIHKKRHHIFADMRALKSTDINELRALADKLVGVEYELQIEWGFTPDSNMHSYWYQVPHCECPYSDNRDAWGHNVKHIDGKCPIHGGMESNSEKLMKLIA